MTAANTRRRQDERQPLLVYLKPEVIRALKTASLIEDTYAYLIVEDALRVKLDLPDHDPKT